MRIRPTIPGLRPATVLLGIYGVVWISLEGNLTRVVILGISVSVITAGHLWQPCLGGRRLSLSAWLLLTTGVGLLLGLGSPLMTLIFMGLKTGLHAHGPEFTEAELVWITGRFTLWGIIGLLSGLGSGLILAATSPSD